MTRFFKFALFALSAFIALSLTSARAADFLDPAEAFKLEVHVIDAKTVEADWTIASGYHMYREQFKAEAQGATLGEPALPSAATMYDEALQKTVDIYRDTLKVKIPVSQANGLFTLTLTGQGCADKGLCYPPARSNYRVNLADGSAQLQADDVNAALTPAATPADTRTTPAAVAAPSANVAAPVANDGITAALQGGHFWTIIGVFLAAGLLLSLTPCVLPMLPILSSIIVGSGKATRSRGFALAVSYSLGMALVYTALGVAAGLAGEGFAAALQKPWVLSVFALALVLFSLSMFGAYELQLPSFLSGGLTNASQKLPAGKMAGVFVMGGVSALIVSPCVAAPLAGALVYISQTRNVLLGGSALFALAAGMSVPLLLLGASAGALLPRAGAWMDGVKHFFGLLLVGVALWMVQPLLAPSLAQALWGALLLAFAAMLGLFEAAPSSRPLAWLRKTAAVIAALAGIAQVLGALAGGTDPLRPLAGMTATAGASKVESTDVKFQAVHSVAELDAMLASAGQPVMLDFYADWCVSCKEMDRDTFTDPAVRQRLAGALLLRADVTANSSDDKALLKRFALFGPPGTIFFNRSGQEASQRVMGFQDAPTFLGSLGAAGL